MEEIGVRTSEVFIKIEQPDEEETEFAYENNPGIFIKEEEPDDIEPVCMFEADVIIKEEITDDSYFACMNEPPALQRTRLNHRNQPKRTMKLRKRRRKVPLTNQRYDVLEKELSPREKRLIARKKTAGKMKKYLQRLQAETVKPNVKAAEKMKRYLQRLQAETVKPNVKGEKPLSSKNRGRSLRPRKKPTKKKSSNATKQSSLLGNNRFDSIYKNSSTSASRVMIRSTLTSKLAGETSAPENVAEVAIKQEESSLFYCGGLIPEKAGETTVSENVPSVNELVPCKKEEGSWLYCEDQDPLENLNSQTMANTSFEPGRKNVKLKKHQCPHCKYRALYPYKLKIHIIACHTNEKPHHCPCCDYKATTSSILKKHIKTNHMDEKPQQCPHCDFTTADILGLVSHINAHNTDNDPHQSSQVQSSNIEIAHHKEENPSQCPYCEYKAGYPNRLKMHIMACHTGEKPYLCPNCDYKAVKISNLRIHILAHHTEEKPHPCPHCDYKTATKSTLKTHIRFRHTGEKPHQCPHCAYKSVTISCLKKHVLARHLGEKPHKCPHCDYRATQRSNLKTHIKYVHMYIDDNTTS